MTDQWGASDCRHSELAVGWALHVLEPAEEILVAGHLPDCEECARTVAETELVGATLGLAIPQHTPSVELEQRVLALTSTPQVPPEPSPRPVSPPAPQPAPRPVTRTARPDRPGGGRPLAGTPASAPRRPPGRRRGRDPLCVPEMLKLIMVALVVLLFAVAVVFLAIP